MAQSKANRVWRVWNQYPAFKRLQISNLLTSLTGWSSFIAMLVLLDDITSSGIELGTLWAISGLAPLAFSLIVGVWVDRVDVKRGLIYADLFRVILVVCMMFVPLLEGWAAWLSYAGIRFLISVCGSFSYTGRQTIIPNIVSKEDLITANSLNFTLLSVMRLVGASIGGVMVALAGVSATLVLTAVAFLISAILISGAHWETKARMKVKSSYLEDIREGFRVAKGNPWIQLIFLLTLSSGMIAGTYNLMVQQYVADVYKVPDYGMSLLFVVEGVVSALAGYWVANKNFSLRTTSRYGWFYMLYGLSWLLFGFSRDLWVGTFSMILFAISMSITIPFERTTMQTQVPEEVRGRVFGLWNTLTTGVMQFGAFAAGVLITYLGTESVPVVMGGLEVLAGLGFLIFVGTKLGKSANLGEDRSISK